MSLHLEKIHFEYESFSLSVDLHVDSGEFISLLGPSGSGKTTLLRILAGFQTPLEGSLVLSDRDLAGIPVAGRNIGMVFQDYALFPHLDVSGNIAYGLKTKKWPKQKIARRVSELLGLVSLAGYEHRRINELSGGEKQRVALARALAPEPELLLFDEPLSALDMKLRKSLRREIRKIQQRLGFTAVYVTHDQEEAMSISDRIAVMNNGRIIQTGTPEELYNSPLDWFTADFIGIMNKITADGSFMFRPESCNPAEPEHKPEKNDISFDAVVESVEYAGGYYVCEASAGQSENVIFYSDNPVKTGEKLTLSVKAGNLMRCD